LQQVARETQTRGAGASAARALASLKGWTVPDDLTDAQGLAPAEEVSRDKVMRNFHGLVTKQVKGSGYDLADCFRMYAKSQRTRPNQVTISSFEKVLGLLGVRMTDEQFDAVREIYGDPKTEELNYVDFCSVVDPENARSTTSPALKGLLASHRPRPPPRKQAGRYFDREGHVRPYLGPRPSSSGVRGQLRAPRSRVIGMTG